MRTAVLVSCVLTMSCQAPVATAPTYFKDVQLILGAHCTRCHGADPSSPTIQRFRLDRYVRNDEGSFDVYDYRDGLVLNAVQGEAPPMPPDYALTPRQQETLRRWVEQGAPKGTRDNHLPKLELLSPDTQPSKVDQELVLTLRTTDEDGDGLLVSMLAKDIHTGTVETLAENVGGGLRWVPLDVGLLISKSTVDLYAIVDDGFFDDPNQNAHQVPLFGGLYVDHGSRGTAPRVTVLTPNGSETLIGQTTISWSASDPDPGDTLTIDIDLLKVDSDGSTVLVSSPAQDLPNVPSVFSWNTAGVATEEAGKAILYVVRVTATDAGAQNTRGDVSDAPFTIAQATTTSYTWADVEPVFAAYCNECHGQPARNPALEYFRTDKYDASDPVSPANSDTGVYENRGQIYQRMVVEKSMPPNANPQPAAAELAMVAQWFQGGAPQSAGPIDRKPTFTWTTPNDSAITKVSTPTVTLRWSASDTEGPITGSIQVVKINATSNQNANCTTSLTAWATVTGADVTSGSFAWTAPSQGYFCFRGLATDAAGQTTTAVAAKPVRYSTTPGP